MRVVEIDRRLVGRGPLALPNGKCVDPAWVISVFDRLRLPDGFAFVVDDDGTVTGCRYLNQYLLDAHTQSGLDLKSMRRSHVYHLGRLLRFLRRSRAESRARDAGVNLDEYWAERGEPKVDLTDAVRADLVAYRNSRKRVLELTSLATEMGCISGFFRYAVAMNWVPSDPVPRWAGRNMLMPRTRKRRTAKFLKAEQTRHFLDVGLRGDGADPEFAPAYPERDYCYGLLLASTGLRREECAFLLDCEVPRPGQMPVGDLHAFRRAGKKDVTRTSYVTQEVAQAVDLYRVTERAAIVQRAQPTLRGLRREGRLHLVDGVTTRHNRPHVIEDGHQVPVEGLTDEQRAVAAYVTDEGTIEPLGLFLSSRGGLPPVLGYWNELFANARDRVAERGDALRPPQHITVSPHTMRHTYAVRMLHGLMQEGRERTGNPYYLLANPVLTVMELLGHASMNTTQDYLFAAETWTEDVPTVLRRTAADLVGHTEPGQAPSAERDA
ncbi:tyrosine-type recombinase/integrase [Micromonospora sp. MS34]|uniref:tyrosine-type recombinase/integrase n=1 Tax=Micromonospora sp. MS34 TaxID=3385971 RepID=UPI0039A0505C